MPFVSEKALVSFLILFDHSLESQDQRKVAEERAGEYDRCVFSNYSMRISRVTDASFHALVSVHHMQSARQTVDWIPE